MEWGSFFLSGIEKATWEGLRGQVCSYTLMNAVVPLGGAAWAGGGGGGIAIKTGYQQKCLFESGWLARWPRESIHAQINLDA